MFRSSNPPKKGIECFLSLTKNKSKESVVSALVQLQSDNQQ